MKNDAPWLRAMANTIRRIARDRELLGSHELASELRGLAVFVQAAALMVEDDDTFRAEAPTPTIRERTQPGIAAPTTKGLRP